MPTTTHRHDKEWAKEQLSIINWQRGHLQVKMICKAYDEAYSAAYTNEPTEHKKENAARLEANTRLRQYIKRLNQQAEAPRL